MSPSCALTVGFEASLLVCRLTYLVGKHTDTRRLPRMWEAGGTGRGNPWTRGPTTACAFFLSLCNAYGRERRTGYYEYETPLHSLRGLLMTM